MVNQSKKEYIEVMRRRYAGAGRPYKKRLLDEVCEVCGYHRKYAIELLNRKACRNRRRPGPRRIYGEAVREVLKDKRLLDNSAKTTNLKRVRSSRTSPVVLNVFHAGVRNLEQALEQVRMIEDLAGRSSVYTVESARAWVCGADVREEAGVFCILDTVKPDGLEKALQKSDILVLPTFCFKTAAKVARLISDDQETAIVLSALIQGKQVLAARDGFTLLDTLSNEAIRYEIEKILGKLESYGIVFSQTDQLADTFQKMTAKGSASVSAEINKSSGGDRMQASRLVTAKDIRIAVDRNQDSILLASDGIVTPLAQDQAKEYAIRIVRKEP